MCSYLILESTIQSCCLIQINNIIINWFIREDNIPILYNLRSTPQKAYHIGSDLCFAILDSKALKSKCLYFKNLNKKKLGVIYLAANPFYDLIDRLISPIECFFCIECHVALDRNPVPGYDTLLLRLISGHGQFHTLPGLLDSRDALSNSYPNACVPSRETVCTIILMVFGMTQARLNFVSFYDGL